MEKWLERLMDEDVKIDERYIDNDVFREVLQIVGKRNAIRLFEAFRCSSILVGTRYLIDLQRQYLLHFCEDKSERDLARELKVSPAKINRLMNKAVKSREESREESGGQSDF